MFFWAPNHQVPCPCSSNQKVLVTNAIYDWVVFWGLMLLYNPSQFLTKIGYETYKSFISLPPLIINIIIPALILYNVHRFIQRLRKAYQDFLDLGRGGTPSTPLGLLRVSIKKFFANVDVLDSPHVPPMLDPYRGQLFDLPKRKGNRPTVNGVAPQRQFDQKTKPETFDALLQMLEAAAEQEENSDTLTVSTSFLEGHTQALRAVFHRGSPPKLWGTDAEWDFEIAHPHRVDGSMHMILHPEDVKTVIEKGWGEKHPLATNAWWWKIFYHYIRHKRRPVPYNLVFLYAPKTKLEWEVMHDILDAAIWFNKERYNRFLAAEAHKADKRISRNGLKGWDHWLR